MSILSEIKEAMISYNPQWVKELTEKALSEGVDAHSIINDGLIAGMNYIGAKFRDNEVYIPEVLVVARAMHAAMDVLKPHLIKDDFKRKATFVIGTVKQDLHDIGKNLVIIMLEGAGYKVVDLGVDVPPEKFARAVEEHRPQIVGISALLTTTLGQMRTTVEHLKPYRDSIKILVGGAPVTQRFADEINADGYAPDAASAVEKANELLGL